MKSLSEIFLKLTQTAIDFQHAGKFDQALLVMTKIHEIAEILGLGEALEKFEDKVISEFGELISIEDISAEALKDIFAGSDDAYQTIKQRAQEVRADKLAA